MSLSLGFDLFVLIVLAVSAVVMSKKGVIKSIFKLGGTIAAIAAVMMLSTPVYEYFDSTAAASKVDEYVQSALSEKVQSETAENADNSGNMPSYIHESLIGGAVGSASEVISSAVKKIICTLIIYAVVRLLVFIVCKMAETMFKLPLLSQVNHLFGGAVGLLSGAVLLFVLFALLSLDVTHSDEIRAAMEQTYAAKYFYDKNLLMQLFLNFR